MICPVRSRKIRVDSEGDGHFGAPRGSRKHIGIDLLSYVGENVLSPVDGVVHRWGRAYVNLTDELYTYRIVVIRDKNGYKHELFYVNPKEPFLVVGSTVKAGQRIGTTQDLRIQYPEAYDMQNHIHLQVKDKDDKIINPMPLYEGILI